MFPDEQPSEVRDVIRTLMEYLIDNPDAKDTVEGIERWWLSGITPGPCHRSVEHALNTLVAGGWVNTIANAPVVYQVSELGLNAGFAYLNHLHLNNA
jgi:hypothetical protein